MKSQIQLDGTGSGTVVAHNIDGFFRARSTTLRPKTPPASDSVNLTATVVAARAATQAQRHPNHARAHKPQPAQTGTIRVKKSVQQSQTLIVRHGPAHPNHTKAHRTQHSKTLMRTAVKRPMPSFRTQAGTVASLQHAVPSLIVSKKSVISLDEGRLVRAQTTAKSPLVGHHTTPKPVMPTVAPIPVAPQPVRPAEQMPVHTPAPQHHKPADMFEHAIANASHYVDIHAHHRAYRKKVRTHVTSMLAGSLVLIAVATFVAYQSSPSLQFRVASVRAGVSAHLPNFAALGFTYNGVKAQDGKLLVGLKQGKAAYTVSQQATNLSSEDMIQTISATDASGTPDYTTVPAGSTTVYRFANNSATWIQNGKWYTVVGTDAISDAQLQKLAQNI
jgi:hypothetical protein